MNAFPASDAAYKAMQTLLSFGRDDDIVQHTSSPSIIGNKRPAFFGESDDEADTTSTTTDDDDVFDFSIAPPDSSSTTTVVELTGVAPQPPLPTFTDEMFSDLNKWGALIDTTTVAIRSKDADDDQPNNEDTEAMMKQLMGKEVPIPLNYMMETNAVDMANSLTDNDSPKKKRRIGHSEKISQLLAGTDVETSATKESSDVPIDPTDDASLADDMKHFHMTAKYFSEKYQLWFPRDKPSPPPPKTKGLADISVAEKDTQVPGIPQATMDRWMSDFKMPDTPPEFVWFLTSRADDNTDAAAEETQRYMNFINKLQPDPTAKTPKALKPVAQARMVCEKRRRLEAKYRDRKRYHSDFLYAQVGLTRIDPLELRSHKITSTPAIPAGSQCARDIIAAAALAHHLNRLKTAEERITELEGQLKLALEEKEIKAERMDAAVTLTNTPQMVMERHRQAHKSGHYSLYQPCPLIKQEPHIQQK